VKRSEQLQLTSYSTAGEEVGGAVAAQMTVTLLLFAAEYLQSRSWQGLEQQLGKTPVSKAAEGRSGTATGYTHEPHT